MTIARGIGFRLGYSFRASAASERRVKVYHNPTVWHIRTLKHSHQPEESEVFILLPTDKCYTIYVNTIYMHIARYMYTLQIVIVARSLRSLVKI